MKKSLIYLFSALGISAATALTLSSCRDYDVLDEEVAKEVAASKEFYNNFVARYGQPDPNHTWGMGKIETMGFFSQAGTRAQGEGTVNVNRNEWTSRNQNATSYNSNALINDVTIPGWPNFDGFYYGSKGGDVKEIICTEADMWAHPNYRTVGDVTDYEIKYVSNYFRTHTSFEQVKLHLSDFFVQNVSWDADQVNYNSYSWPSGGTLPTDGGYNGANIERASDIAPNGSALDACRTAGTDYTVGKITRKNPNYGNESINFALDQLQFKSIGGGATPDAGGWTHINNFNSGNTNFNPESKNQTNNREIMYVHSAGTEDFACKSVMSIGDKKVWINDWVLVKLDWDEPGADGTVRHREGYYLAFDFSCETNDTKVERDGYYSNWIIKITPAYITPTPTKNVRVMCEDLGNTFDFDFNDVVYDVMNTNDATVIQLQAAGGTLPIWVGIEPSTANHVNTDIYEAHSMLGATSSSTPINVDAGTEKDVAIYRIQKVDNLGDIGIWVDYNDGNGPKKIPTTAGENGDFGENGSIYGDPLPGKGDNKAPMRFAVPSTVKWMKETRFIEHSYIHFKEWVKDQNYVHEGDSKKWYEIWESTEKIHNFGKEETVTPGTLPETPVSPWITLTPYTDISFDDVQSIIRIATYTGKDPIWQVLNGYSYDDKQISFTYVYKTSASELDAILIPVYVKEVDGVNVPYYKAADGTETSVTKSIINSYRSMNLQTDYPDKSKNFFSYTFSFSKRQLKPDGTRYCDYILLYFKEVPDDLTLHESFYHY